MVTGRGVCEVIGQEPLTCLGAEVKHMVKGYHKCGYVQP